MAAVCILKSFSVQENGLVALYEVWSFLILQINDVQTLLLFFFFSFQMPLRPWLQVSVGSDAA